MVDVVPTSPHVPEFWNAWFSHALATAQQVTLRDETGDLPINVITAPAFLATKLASFASRGNGDFSHRDIEDIVYLIDGRAELLRELEVEVQDLRAFVSESMRNLLRVGLEEKVAWHLPVDAASQAREPLVIERLRRIANLTESGT